MAAPWWLTTKYNFDPEQGSSQAFYDATTGRQVYESGGKYYYSLPTEGRWEPFAIDETASSYRYIDPTSGEAVPASLLNSQPQSAQVLGGSGVNGLAQIRLADGTVTNATPINGDANDYSKLFQGMVPGEGYSQVPGQGAPQTQLVKGSDGNMYAALPGNAQFNAVKPDDSGFMSGFMKDFAPLAMAALPFSGLGSSLSGMLGGGTLGNVGANAVIGAGKSLLTGGDPLQGGFNGALMAGANGLLRGSLTDSPVFDTPAQDMTGFQTPQSADPSQIWQTPDPLANLNQPPASDYLNAPVSGAPSMDITDLWPTTGAADPIYNLLGSPADNYLNNGVMGDPSQIDPNSNYFNLTPDAGANPSMSGGSTIQNFIKGLLGAGASAGGGAPSASGLSGLLGGNNSSLLLPLLGGLLGSMSGGAKPAGTTTTVNDIPDWQKPYVTNAFGAAGNALNDANAAYAATKPTTDLATSNMNATLRGDYLGSNPALDGMFNTAANSVANKVNSAFSSAGRYGSGAQTSTLTEGLGNLANNIYGQNYQQERQRQFAGSLAAPSYSQGMTQAAYGPASGYANIVRQPVGSTQSSPYFTNPLGGAVSGLLGGYALSRA